MIRKNYNEISALCKRTKEPVFLTKNGEGDLVVMDLETYAQRENMLKLREKLLQSEGDIQYGRVRTVEETASDMRRVIAVFYLPSTNRKKSLNTCAAPARDAVSFGLNAPPSPESTPDSMSLRDGVSAQRSI